MWPGRSSLLCQGWRRRLRRGLARRFAPAQWQAVEAGLAAVTGRMLALVPAARAAALADGEDILHGHSVRDGKAMIATLRRRLVAVLGRLIRHVRHLILRLPPGHLSLDARRLSEFDVSLFKLSARVGTSESERLVRRILQL